MKKFYLFHQNNSGGYFIQNDSVDIYVMIQAESAEDANNKAEDLSIKKLTKGNPTMQAKFDNLNKGLE